MNEKQVTINKSWFDTLVLLRDKYEKKPSEYNLAMLMGYISSADFISKNLGQLKK